MINTTHDGYVIGLSVFQPVCLHTLRTNLLD